MEIEESDIDKFESDLKSKDSNYTANPSVDNAKTAEEKKLKALENKESIILDQMESIAGENQTLVKYVNKVKLEIRMKATEVTIKLADDEMEKNSKKDSKERC